MKDKYLKTMRIEKEDYDYLEGLKKKFGLTKANVVRILLRYCRKNVIELADFLKQ